MRENVEVAALVAAVHRNGSKRSSVDEIVAGSGLWDHRDRRAAELDYGNSRRLELARAAAAAPAFLLLDEPTSGMSDSESLAMVESVRRMAAAVGAGVLVIDHDLNFITGICDRVYCLDQGRVIASGTPAEVQAHPRGAGRLSRPGRPAGQGPGMTIEYPPVDPRRRRRGSLADEVVTYVRDLILAGSLKPGTKIDQDAIGEVLDVSRSPVREGLVILGREGLVEITPRRGASVANPDSRRHRRPLRAVRGGGRAGRPPWPPCRSRTTR